MSVKIKEVETPSGLTKLETQHSELDNPPVPIAEDEQDIEEVGKRFKRRAIDLTDEQSDQLKTELNMMITDWEDSRSGLEQKLRDGNDLVEGVTEDSDFPWPGACSIHLQYPKVKAREISSAINRTFFRPSPFMMTTYAGPDSEYEKNKEFVKALEFFLEDKLKNDTNIHATLKETPIPVFRDGTAIIQIMWETSYEMVTDWKLYDATDEFQKDYPDPDAADLDADEYNRILTLLTRGGKYEAEYERMVATYDGPKAYLVPLQNFFHWPVFVPSIRETACHGKEIWYTDYQLWEKVRSGLFRKEDIEEITAAGGQERDEAITSSRDSIEGISRGTANNVNEHQIFELVYTTALTDQDKKNNVVRKYLIYYHYKLGRILRVEKYPVRKGKVSYFALKFIPRDNRLLGMSLADDISDLSEEADVLIRQMTNSRTITHVPSFKATLASKPYFDPSRRELRFRPGRVFYLPKVEDVAQFDIRPVDLSGSWDQVLLMFQMMDMVTGSSSGLSGQTNPLDPRAPARKQQQLLRQSSNRLDDYVGNMIPVFEEIAQFTVDLYYQNASDRIKYYVPQESGQVFQNQMERAKLYDPNVKFRINGTSVFNNPEEEYQAEVQNYTMVASSVLTAQNPRILRTALERVFLASRARNVKELLPRKDEMPEAIKSEAEVEEEHQQNRAKEKAAMKLSDAQAKRETELEVVKTEVEGEAKIAAMQAMMDVAAEPSPQAGGDVVA